MKRSSKKHSAYHFLLTSLTALLFVTVPALAGEKGEQKSDSKADQKSEQKTDQKSEPKPQNTEKKSETKAEKAQQKGDQKGAVSQFQLRNIQRIYGEQKSSQKTSSAR